MKNPMGTPEVVQRAQKQKSLVQSGKVVDPKEQLEVLREAWKGLCRAQGMTLKEFSAYRGLIDACANKWKNLAGPDILGAWIFADLQEANERADWRLLSRCLAAALDAESTKKSLKSLVQDDSQKICELLRLTNHCLHRVSSALFDSHGKDLTTEYMETQRDVERVFDCISRILTFASSVRLDADLVDSLYSETETVILTLGKTCAQLSGDIHSLRSACLAFFHINAAKQESSSLESIIFSGNLDVNQQHLPALIRSSLLLGALSCSANNSEVDNEEMLKQLLDALEKCLMASGEQDEEDAEDTDDTVTSKLQLVETEQAEERLENFMLAAEALCAWSTKVKSCQNVTPILLDRAIKLVIFYSDHRESSIGTICATAFERLIEGCLRVPGGEDILSKIFVEQLTHVSSADFASARRGLYPMVEKLVTVLGANRVLTLQPNFVSLVINSAFRVNDMSSNRPELGNGICNLIVTFLRTWMTDLSYKVTKEMKAQVNEIADVLKRGPDNLFASYFICRRLLSDLFGESKSSAELEAINEVAQTILTRLQDARYEMANVSYQQKIDESLVGMKRTLEVSRSEQPPKPRHFYSASPQDLLWARINVLLALERSGTHIVIIEADANESSKKKRKQLNEFTLESSVLWAALINESAAIRDAAWALASTRVKRAKFPEPIVLELINDSLPFVLKYTAIPLKPSLLRLYERIYFCLENGVGGGDGEEDAKVTAKQFLIDSSQVIGSCIYVGAPYDRISLALDLCVGLIQMFKRSNFLHLIQPLLSPGCIRSMIGALRSPFDNVRSQAFEFLCAVPGKLSGFETREEVEQEINNWLPLLKYPMRREADSCALFLRLIHSKFCVELGWKIDLPKEKGFIRPQITDNAFKLEAVIESARDAYFMRVALEEARKCETVETAYDVGCVIVSRETGEIISTGYSREFPGNTHAEECALRKLGNSESINWDDCANGNAANTTLYTTMEPCSLRLSGNRPCASRCIAAKVARVVVGVKEPEKFVQNCEGWLLLERKGVIVQSVNDDSVLEECAVMANSNDHTVPKNFDESKKRNWDNFKHREDLPRELVSVDFFEQILSTVGALTESASQESIHGYLMTLRYIIRDMQATIFNNIDLANSLLTILMNTLQTGVASLIAMESSEIMMSTMENQTDEDFIMKSTSWLAIREGSEVLSEYLEKLMKAPMSDKREIISEKDIIMCCNWFLTTSLKLRHLGAMTYVTKGVERVCRLLLQSESQELQRVPVALFVPELFSKLGIEEFDRALRRTEGFSLTFRAIARAGQITGRTDIIHLLFKELIQIATSDPPSPPKKLIATLNVLCVLFEDSILAKSVTAFISASVELAVSGFRSYEWGVRSSSLNLFVSLIKRAVGEPDQSLDSGETTKAHSTTARLFFKSHPRLYPFLLKELTDAVKSPEHPSLHPVLLFLSSLRRSSFFPDDPALEFIPLVEKVALNHPQYLMRSTASRALVVLTPFERAPIQQLADVLSNDTAPANMHHGALMQLLQWAKAGLKSDLARDKQLSATLKDQFIACSSRCFLLRYVALECYDRFFSKSDERQFLDCLYRVFTTEIAFKNFNEMADGSNVGYSRFRSQLTRLLIKHAVCLNDWGYVVSALSTEHNHPDEFDELASQLKERFERKEGINITAVDCDVVVNCILPCQMSLSPIPRSVMSYRLEALAAFVDIVASSNNEFSLSAEVLSVVYSLSQQPCNLKSRAACLQLLSRPFGNITILEHLVDVIEQDSQSEAPLELRIASAIALSRGCLSPPKGEKTELHLRCWIRALYLLQDDDREVCDLARRAVLSAIETEGVCLSLTLDRAWTKVTDEFWQFPLWQQTLLKLIFPLPQENSEDVASTEFQAEEINVLYKVDNPNEFFEPGLFADFASREALRVKRLRYFSGRNDEDGNDDGGCENEYRELARKATQVLGECVHSFNQIDSETAFLACFRAIMAVYAFADNLDHSLAKTFHQFNQKFSTSAPVILKDKIDQIVCRLWGGSSEF